MKRLLLFLPVLLLLAGCMTDEIRRNLNNAEKLRVGMTKEQVLAIMGEPLSQEAFNTPDCWYYFVEVRWIDGLYTEDECMPLVFKDGKLVGWGNEYLARVRGVAGPRKSNGPERYPAPAR